MAYTGRGPLAAECLRAIRVGGRTLAFLEPLGEGAVREGLRSGISAGGVLAGEEESGVVFAEGLKEGSLEVGDGAHVAGGLNGRGPSEERVLAGSKLVRAAPVGEVRGEEAGGSGGSSGGTDGGEGDRGDDGRETHFGWVFGLEEEDVECGLKALRMF